MTYGPPVGLADCSQDDFPWRMRTQSEHLSYCRHLHKISNDPNVTEATKDKFKQETGVCGLGTLCRLPYYDIIKDSCLDIMHILEGVTSHLMKMLKGERLPNDPNKRKKKKGNNGMIENNGDGPNEEELQISSERQHVISQHNKLFIPENERKRMDELFKSINAPPGFINTSQKPWTRTGISLQQYFTVITHQPCALLRKIDDQIMIYHIVLYYILCCIILCYITLYYYIILLYYIII